MAEQRILTEEQERTLGRELMHSLDLHVDGDLAVYARTLWDSGVSLDQVANRFHRACRACEVLGLKDTVRGE